MAEGSSDEDKTEEASAHKIAEANKKGDFAKSGDLPQAMSLIGACAVIALYGPAMAQQLAEVLVPFIDHPDQLMMSLEGDGGQAMMRIVLLKVLPVVMSILGAALILGVGGHVLQTGLVFVPDKLKPKWEMLNPMSGFKRLYGVDALVQFAKTLVKLVVTGAIVYNVLKGRAAEVLTLTGAAPVVILPYAREILIAVAMAVCIFLFVGGGLDYLWQRFRFMQRMKMSKQEQKDEYKQMEGDPFVKAKLKAIRQEKSRQRMMANVAKATVVITNPTHYAVALRYEAEDGAPPICLAKGVDDVALRIREMAKKHDVPIVEDRPLARALYATVDLDEVIPESHFAAVAKIIGFVMTKRKRGF